jgi:hypothetical protein
MRNAVELEVGRFGEVRWCAWDVDVSVHGTGWRMKSAWFISNSALVSGFYVLTRHIPLAVDGRSDPKTVYFCHLGRPPGLTTLAMPFLMME